MEEIIFKIKNAEKNSIEKIEKEKKNYEKILDEKKIKADEFLKTKKKQHVIFYEKEIENLKIELEEEKKEFNKYLKLVCLEYEEASKKNSVLATRAIIEEILKKVF